MMRGKWRRCRLLWGEFHHDGGEDSFSALPSFAEFFGRTDERPCSLYLMSHEPEVTHGFIRHGSRRTAQFMTRFAAQSVGVRRKSINLRSENEVLWILHRDFFGSLLLWAKQSLKSPCRFDFTYSADEKKMRTPCNFLC